MLDLDARAEHIKLARLLGLSPLESGLVLVPGLAAMIVSGSCGRVPPGTPSAWLVWASPYSLPAVHGAGYGFCRKSAVGRPARGAC